MARVREAFESLLDPLADALADGIVAAPVVQRTAPLLFFAACGVTSIAQLVQRVAQPLFNLHRQTHGVLFR